MTNSDFNARWPRTLLTLALLLLFGAAVYWPSLSYLLHIWGQFTHGDYGHGYLVVILIAYMIYLNREQLAMLVPCPTYAPLLVILLSSLLWLLAALVDVRIVQLVSLVLVLFGIAWTILGHQVIRQLAYPLSIIFLAIPIWFPVTPVLQDLTANAAFWVIRLIKVPAFLQENMIIVPAGVLSVEEACSGQRYLLAALILGAFYGYLNYSGIKARILVILISTAAALLANIVRVVIVVYLGYSTNMQHPLVSDHMTLGWYLFGGLVAILLFIDNRVWHHCSLSRGQRSIVDESTLPLKCKSLGVPALLSILAVASGPMILFMESSGPSVETVGEILQLPAGERGWAGPVDSITGWEPIYSGALSAKKDYLKRGERVSLYIAYYKKQKQGGELINVDNRIADMKTWDEEYVQPHVRELNRFKVLEQHLRSDNEERLVWYWYNIGGWSTTSFYMAKVLQLGGDILGRPEAYLVAASVDIKTNVSVSRQVLESFINDMQLPFMSIELSKENELSKEKRM